MKACTICKENKESEDFFKDKRTKSGLYSACKVCHLKRRIRKPNNSVGFIESRNTYARKYRQGVEQKIKQNARQKVYLAIKEGKIVRQPCEKCGEKSEAHHPDYSKPLEVKWLCIIHHTEEHRCLKQKIPQPSF